MKRYDNTNRCYTNENLLSKRINLSQDALEIFTNKDLFYMIMSCDYFVSDYAKALAHLCYGNVELSRKICQYAIDCRYEGTGPNYLKVLRYQLQLDDTDAATGESLQAKRLEWVFGTPQPKFLGDTKAAKGIQVGLDSFDYNIESEAYEFVTALNYDEPDENVSILQVLVRSHFIGDLMKTVADAAVKLHSL